MYLTIKQKVKHLSKKDFLVLRELCHVGKNLANEAIYNIRQYYFAEGKYINDTKNYALLKSSENYRILNSNMAQQILKEVDGMFKSFFGLLNLAKAGKCSFKNCKLPKYLPKDSFTTLIIGFVRLNGNKFVLPFSNSYRKTHQMIEIKLPPILLGKRVQEIRIIPKSNARFFEIQYTYEVENIQRNLNINNALALDLGVNNLITAVSSAGKSFIVDGKRLKSINQWYNKENARLQSIKDKQKCGKEKTKQQGAITQRRNRLVNDYISKAVKIIINYCIENDIGTLVCGYSETFQRGSNLGKSNNQTFCFIPFGKLRDKLHYLCELHSIKYVEQEESYTSKASFWDNDIIPKYNDSNQKEYTFSGKRIHRGMYKTSAGHMLNADVNGALNILRKSSVVSLSTLYSRGTVDVPLRIRVS